MSGKFAIVKRSEMKLVEQAVGNRWPITQEYRALCVARMMQILADPATNARTAISATRALAALDSLNQHEHEQSQTHDARNRFLDVAKRLGIGSAVEGTSEG